MARLGILVFTLMSLAFAWFHVEIAYALDVTGISGKTPVIPQEKFSALSQAEWQLHEASSFESWQGEGLPENAWDGDPETFWHSAWKDSNPTPPHHLAIDLGRSAMIYAVEYLPRQGGENGRVKDYRLQISEDGASWRDVATGAFTREPVAQLARLRRPVSGRFLRIECLSEVNDKSWASIAELRVLTIE